MKPLMQLVTEWREKQKRVDRNEASFSSIDTGLCADALEARLREIENETFDVPILCGNQVISVHHDILGVSPPPEKESQG